MWPTRFDEERAGEYRRAGQWLGRTLFDAATLLAERDPQAQLYPHEPHPLDIAGLIGAAEALAASLWEMGLRPGDVAAFQLPNWLEAVVVNLAACRLGLICNPLVPIYRDAELAFMLNDSHTKVVFIPTAFRAFDYAAMYERIRRDLMSRPIVVTVRGTHKGMESYESLVASGSGRAPRWPLVETDSVKLILYTSGTTGRPKGVLHTHETLARAIRVSAAHWSLDAGDAVLMASPITHSTGYANALELPFLHGTRAVLMDRWDARQAVELIDRYSVVATVGATPFLKELTSAAAASGSGLPSLRVFACGGAAVPPEVIHAANVQFVCRPAFRVYGSTEAPYTALGRPGPDALEAAATTDGEIVDYETRILDESGDELPRTSEGEIAIRGPALFVGYWNAEDNQGCFTSDGYFRTGDMGTISADGWITITGRKKDLIIRGGENISAKEIEDALHRCPEIVEAAVVAMPHERLGEGVFGFVISRNSEQPTLQAVIEHLEDCGLARQKFPERIALVPDFPRTASGKIKKDILRLMAADLVRRGT